MYIITKDLNLSTIPKLTCIQIAKCFKTILLKNKGFMFHMKDNTKIQNYNQKFLLQISMSS
jgi:hypothetical protein